MKLILFIYSIYIFNKVACPDEGRKNLDRQFLVPPVPVEDVAGNSIGKNRSATAPDRR